MENKFKKGDIVVYKHKSNTWHTTFPSEMEIIGVGPIIYTVVIYDNVIEHFGCDFVDRCYIKDRNKIIDEILQ